MAKPEETRWTWIRKLMVGVAGALGAIAGFGVAIGGPFWLNTAAAGMAAASALVAVAVDVGERREQARPRDEWIEGGGTAPSLGRRTTIDELPDDALVVFVSYAPEDETWRRRFERMLRPLGERGVFVYSHAWTAVGAARRLEVRRAIARADAALVLVTPDLLASEVIMGDELPALSARAIPVACVHVRASMLEEVDALGAVEWMNNPAQPVASAAEYDGEIVRACRRLVALLPVAATQSGSIEWGGTHARQHVPRLERAFRPGALHSVPVLPPEFVERDELAEVREALLGGGDGIVGITGRGVGLHGQGGIGKTVLAAALARDTAVRSYFPEGVFWITVGEHPDLVGLQIGLLERFGAARPEFRSIAACNEALRGALVDRRCLLIVDDVWTVAAAAAFAVTGLTGRVLYTTRDETVLEAVGSEVRRVGVLLEGAARSLLARLTGADVDALPDAAERVLARTGRVALALALVGAAIGRGGRGWEEAADALERGERTFLDHPYADVFKAMQVGIAALDDQLAAAYRTLVVYPEDTRVPLAAVGRLWAHISDVSLERTRAQLEQLAARELLVFDRDTIAFHDLQREFLLLRAGDMRLLHEDLLAAYRALLPEGQGDWWRLPPDEPYIWEHLLEHLRGTGHVAGMHAVATDLSYLAARCVHDGPYGAESDLHAAAQVYGGDETIAWLIALFSRSGRLFENQRAIASVAAAIAIRAQDPPAPLSLSRLRSLTSAPLLTPRWGLPEDSTTLVRAFGGPTSGLVFGSDGRTLTSVEGVGTLRTWTIESGEEVDLAGRRSVVHWHQVVDEAVFARGGGNVAVVAGGSVRLWDVMRGRQMSVLRGRDLKCAFSSDGRTLAVGDRPRTSRNAVRIRLCDVDGGMVTTLVAGDHDWLVGLAFAPDGRTLASAHMNGELRLWEIASRTQMIVIDAELSPSSGPAFAPDGRTLASGGRDGTVQFWDVDSGAQTNRLSGATDWVRAVAFAPDGRTLASAGDDALVRIWDVCSGEQIGVFEGHVGPVRYVAFAPDGRTLASAGNDGILLWNPGVAKQPTEAEHYDRLVWNVAFAPDGRTLASAGRDGAVRLWDVATGRQSALLESRGEPVTEVAFSPDGQSLASASGRTVRLWNLDNRTKTCELTIQRRARESIRGLSLRGQRDGYEKVGFASDGGTLASLSGDGTVRLWDLHSGTLTDEIRIRYGWRGPVAAFAPDGVTLASGGPRGTIQLWSRQRARWGRRAWGVMQRRRWPTVALTSPSLLSRTAYWSTSVLAFAPDGKTLADANGWRIRLWHYRRGRWGRRSWGIMPRRRWAQAGFRSFGSLVTALAFAPDGQTLACTSEAGRVSLWDVNSGQMRYHANIGLRITALEWHPGGIALATSSGVIVLDFVEEAPRGRLE